MDFPFLFADSQLAKNPGHLIFSFPEALGFRVKSTRLIAGRNLTPLPSSRNPLLSEAVEWNLLC